MTSSPKNHDCAWRNFCKQMMDWFREYRMDELSQDEFEDACHEIEIDMAKEFAREEEA